MDLITKTLIRRLVDKGIGIKTIPALMRTTINAIGDNDREQDVKELARRIQFLGWHDFELDDHTYQLIIANLESQALDMFGNLVPRQSKSVKDG